ncbi:dihydrolipoyl dehydrogenase family protein [Microbacterium sediminis]|uniref:Pyridine nucleotide-disulfide oxidoreductase n=1 Tax=Microbacterium sediminis TaxID=904291 RepID=A0A1B9NCB8_9MICO|nr:NAD(P)/FAD-dependent oxidoreductase [Microbacterium sediminis]OCG74240.1 pyridine nucleotide-disulfide oxidoreductase [Microbacterium sediminis]QBR73596.1 NAD(P)/FAD-dependent oxidoreductase [Microbacterium sediminis]
MDTREVDVVVIGAGPVGENVADRTAKGGLQTVIVEAELVGGECSYWACMPSKALLRPGAALRAAQAVRGVTGGALDPHAILARRDEFAAHWHDDGQVEWLASAGIELVRGHGRIVGDREVRVAAADGEVALRARHAVVVATGSTPRIPETPGLRESRPWTSREATSAQRVPERLAVIGGGVVAVEAATFFRDLGSEVTVLARGALLHGLEPFAGEAVRDGLRERGVDVREGASAEAVVRDVDVRLTLAGGEVVHADEVLVATGRAPRTSGIGLDAVGREPGRAIEVDDTLRSPAVPWLYAAGDANGRALLTHQGKYQARAAGDAIVARVRGEALDDGRWGRHAASADHDAVPQVVFTDPEVAAVGITAAQAEERGLRHRVIDYDLAHVAGAGLLADGFAGRVRAIVDEERRVIVGLTLVGPGVGEMLHAGTIAVVGEVPLERLWHAVPSYPTVSEFWLRLLEAYGL